MSKSKKIRINSLDDIFAEHPIEWLEQGRLSSTTGGSSNPFSYIWKGKVCFIHCFKSDEDYIYSPESSGYESDEPVVYRKRTEEIERKEIPEYMERYANAKGLNKIEYLSRKNIAPYHKIRRESGTDFLWVPLYDQFMCIRSFQFLYNDRKLFLPGVSTKELFYTDSSKLGDTLFLAEGFATYKSISKYTTFPGIACMSKSNLLRLEKKFRDEGKKVIVFHDLDNEALATSPKIPSDWNDAEITYLKEENEEVEGYKPSPEDISVNLQVQIGRLIKRYLN